jgi:hypothetical protein
MSNPGFNQGLTPFYLTNEGGEPLVKPGVWRPDMLAQQKRNRRNFSFEEKRGQD